jgi:hypothetical protein
MPKTRKQAGLATFHTLIVGRSAPRDYVPVEQVPAEFCEPVVASSEPVDDYFVEPSSKKQTGVLSYF